MATKYAFAKQLKEVRFLLCQSSEASASLRTFITKSYPVMKKHNPNIPILIREAFGTSPRVFARFEFGKETSIPLEGLWCPKAEVTITSELINKVGLSEKDIEDKVTTLVKTASS